LRALLAAGLVAPICIVGAPGRTQSYGPKPGVADLITAYPAFLDRIDGNALVWKDGMRMVIDDGHGPKAPEALLASPDIKDMFSMPYRTGSPTGPPAVNDDPGRARNIPFFDKMYGDCHSGMAARNLTDVAWLPKKWGHRLSVTRVNDVAGRLAAVSKELDDLPARFDVFLFPSAGTYNCRPIAGTNRVSAHGYGIAIDLSTKESDYWLWAGAKPGGVIPYRNKLPMEIVSIFEQNGFIWGGKWYHYDTMHFEYRPELMPRAAGQR